MLLLQSNLLLTTFESLPLWSHCSLKYHLSAKIADHWCLFNAFVCALIWCHPSLLMCSVTGWLNYVFNIQPFTRKKITPNFKHLPKKIKNCQIQMNPPRIAKSFNFFPKWRNFAKSGHNDIHPHASQQHTKIVYTKQSGPCLHLHHTDF